MTYLQILNLFQFVLGCFLLWQGDKTLNEVADKTYPNEFTSGFRPSSKLLNKIRENFTDDKIIIGMVKKGRLLRKLGWISIFSIMLTWFIFR